MNRRAFVVALCLSVPAMPQPPSGAELLRDFLGAPSYPRQFKTAQKIIALNDRSILPALEPWLQHDRRTFRGNAAYIFASLGDRRGFEVILAMVGDLSARGEAPDGFPQGSSGGGDNSSPPIWSLEQQLRADRYFAVHLLGVLKDPAAIPVLARYLDDPAINYKIPWALEQIGTAEAVQVLRLALAAKDPSVSKAARESLAVLQVR